MNKKKIFTAVITPFNHFNTIDFDSLKKIILKLKADNTHGLVLAGSTGEAATLSSDEKLELFEFGSKFRSKNFEIMAGVGSNNTQASVDFVNKANKIKLDSYLVVSPYYNKPSQEDLIYHFSQIAQASNVPNCIYEIPSRTGVSIHVETVLKLSRHKNIYALKDSNPDLMRIFRIKSKHPNFVIFSGDDISYLPSLSLGSDGLISVLSHVLGKELIQLSECFLKNKFKQAWKLQNKIVHYSDQIFSVTNPVGIKTLLSHRGMCASNLRGPLQKLTNTQSQKLVKSL